MIETFGIEKVSAGVCVCFNNYQEGNRASCNHFTGDDTYELQWILRNPLYVEQIEVLKKVYTYCTGVEFGEDG